MEAGKLLRIYLQDHDALAVITDRLIGRSLSSNKGSRLGDLLIRLQARAAEDRKMLHEVMHRLDVRSSRLKTSAAWVAERSGRLKLNGRLLRYSDLSRVFELEALGALLTMRVARWESLRALAGSDERLAGMDFDDLIERTREDVHDLSRAHRDAAKTAL